MSRCHHVSLGRFDCYTEIMLEQNATAYLSRQEVDNFEAVLNDPDCHQFLAVVTSVHHQRVDLKNNIEDYSGDLKH